MAQGILSIIGSLLLVVIGLWKYFGRKNAEKRKIADEAKEKLDNAHQNQSKSDLLDAWDRINRVR